MSLERHGDRTEEPSRAICFGAFELDVRTGELHKHGLKIRLQEQPFQILLMLLRRPGDVVLREEIRKRLWPNDTIVEFAHSINAAIQRLRDALGDSADNPRYVETIARRGYRFIGELISNGGDSPEPVVDDGKGEALPHEPPPDTSSPDASDLSGRTILHYRVYERLGTGGMGEVYRARDIKLGRDVALKVLPNEFSQDADRMARFEREAQVLASLNHPNIAAIYGLEEADGIRALVMELVEGQTLGERIERGTIPLKEGLRLGQQIADALGAAHEKGIVHRDLKPANVKITPQGVVKVLDYGLAMMQSSWAEIDHPENSPMRATTFSQAGAILGTPAYMAPEQAKGQPVDRRADIWAFGVVLYEMLTGKRLFGGETTTEILSEVLTKEPKWESVPVEARRLLRACLQKDLGQRLQAIGDWRLLFEDDRIGGGQRLGSKLVWPLIAALLALTTVGLVLVLRLKQPNPERMPGIRPITYSGQDSAPAASPDHRTIAYSSDRDGNQKIWLKDLATGGEMALTSGPSDSHPRFSADGSSILFARTEPTHGFVHGRDSAPISLYRVALIGGEPRKIVDDAESGDWSPDGRWICYVCNRVNGAELGIISAAGEHPHIIATVPNRTLMYPRWSPDGRTIALVDPFQGATPAIFLIDTNNHQVRSISPPRGQGFAISSAVWNGSGEEIIYAQAESAITGLGVLSASPAWLIRQNIQSSRAQRLLYLPYSSECLDILAPGLLIFDMFAARQSLREVPIAQKLGSPATRILTQGDSQDRQPVYSPDGEWVAFSSNRSGTFDLWAISVRNGMLRQLTDHSLDNEDPTFTSDGKHLVWSSNRSGHFEIWTAEPNGNSAKQITNHAQDSENPAATPDGWIYYGKNDDTDSSQGEFWKIRPDGSKNVRFLSGELGVPEPSPDGRFLAFTEPAGVRVVKIDEPSSTLCRIPGASRFHWMPDGRALVFLDQKQGRNAISQHSPGIFVQDFALGRDTSRTRRPIDALGLDANIESFGISPDGSRITVSIVQSVSNLMRAERVPAIAPPLRHSASE